MIIEKRSKMWKVNWQTDRQTNLRRTTGDQEVYLILWFKSAKMDKAPRFVTYFIEYFIENEVWNVFRLNTKTFRHRYSPSNKAIVIKHDWKNLYFERYKPVGTYRLLDLELKQHFVQICDKNLDYETMCFELCKSHDTWQL